MERTKRKPHPICFKRVGVTRMEKGKDWRGKKKIRSGRAKEV